MSTCASLSSLVSPTVSSGPSARWWRIFICFRIVDFPLSPLFLYFYRIQVYLGSYLWVRVSETHKRLRDLTYVTLADEDTNSILTDNANRAIQGMVTMQVTNLVTKFLTSSSVATWWPNLEPMQVAPPDDQMLNKCKWCHLAGQFSTDTGNIT